MIELEQKWANQPRMVTDAGDWIRLKKLASERRGEEARRTLSDRLKQIDRYWKALLGMGRARPGRRRLPYDKTKAFGCAWVVERCLRRLESAYEKKRSVKQQLGRAIKRRPELLIRKLVERGFTHEEAELVDHSNSPLQAAYELVSKSEGVDADMVARYHRRFRKKLRAKDLPAATVKPSEGQ